MKARFVHFRIPNSILEGDESGIPHPNELFYYSRAFGWGITGGLEEEPSADPSPRGGATICYVETDDGKTGALGIALCSFSDNFSYERGRKIAFNRAILRFQGEQTGPWGGGRDRPDREYIGDDYAPILTQRNRAYLAGVKENE